MKKFVSGVGTIDMSSEELTDFREQQKTDTARTLVTRTKAECKRRILDIMSEDEQRNTLAAGLAALMLYGTDPKKWPVELADRQAASMTMWKEIERLRARSNEIENMNPPPSNVVSDKLWS